MGLQEKIYFICWRTATWWLSGGQPVLLFCISGRVAVFTGKAPLKCGPCFVCEQSAFCFCRLVGAKLQKEHQQQRTKAQLHFNGVDNVSHGDTKWAPHSIAAWVEGDEFHAQSSRPFWPYNLPALYAGLRERFEMTRSDHPHFMAVLNYRIKFLVFAAITFCHLRFMAGDLRNNWNYCENWNTIIQLLARIWKNDGVFSKQQRFIFNYLHLIGELFNGRFFWVAILNICLFFFTREYLTSVVVIEGIKTYQQIVFRFFRQIFAKDLKKNQTIFWQKIVFIGKIHICTL